MPRRASGHALARDAVEASCRPANRSGCTGLAAANWFEHRAVGHLNPLHRDALTRESGAR